MPVKFYILPGFLGLSHEWDGVISFEPQIIVDPYSINLPSEQIDLNRWASNFNASVFQIQQSSQNSPKPILLGYSMGGRLAIHALLQAPDLWGGAIIISANPGLVDSNRREKRLLQDELWAERFENEDWSILMRDWNAQPVFRFDQSIVRHEKDYSRKNLSNTLRYWSLGKQTPLIEKIYQLPMPILWMAGGKDILYAEAAQKMNFLHHQSQVWIMPEAGHRIPWACGDLFNKKLEEFLKAIEV